MYNTKIMYAALVSVSFLWGTSFAAAKTGMKELTPMNLVTFRFIIAATVFGLILTRLPGQNRIERADVPKFLLLGFLAITSYFYIQYTSLLYTTTINAALIVATSPIFTALLSVGMKQARLNGLNAAGILVAFAGVALIITNGQFFTVFQSDTLIGDLMLLTNALVWAGFTFYGGTIMKKYPAFTVMAYIHIFGTLLLVPLALFPSAAAPIPLQDQIGGIGLTTILSALYLALLCSCYAYYVWYEGVNRIGAVRTAVFSYLNPLFAIFAGIAFMGEGITGYIIAGALLVIAGVYLTNKKELP